MNFFKLLNFLLLCGLKRLLLHLFFIKKQKYNFDFGSFSEILVQDNIKPIYQ